MLFRALLALQLISIIFKGGLTVSLTFGWTDAFVRGRKMYYPPQEGDRTCPYSDHYWSPVEVMPLEEIRELQWQKFQVISRYVYEHSGMYRRKWDAAGVKPEDIRSWDDFTRLPVVAKGDFEADQKEHPPFGEAPTIPPSFQMKYWQTSGSTGTPRRWAETKEDFENNMYLFTRALYAHGIRPGWRAYLAFGYLPFLGFWAAHYAAEMMDCQVITQGNLPKEVWLRIMQDLAHTAPAFFCATPTYAIRHIDWARDMGIDLRELGVKILTLAGEPGATVPATKEYLEQNWGAQVHDVLGSTETGGPIFFTCREQASQKAPNDHINLDYFIVEALDPETLKPVDQGKGVACVTSLFRHGMPAIRYILGDYIEVVTEQCECGRTLPMIKGGVQAAWDKLVVVSGVNIYPSQIENIVREMPELAPEYVLVKHKHSTGVTVQVEAGPQTDRNLYNQLAQKVAERIKQVTMVTMNVEVMPPNSLPRFEAKSKRVVEE